MADVLKQHEKENKRLWIAVLTLITCIAVIAGSMIWVVLNMQNALDTAMWNALMQAGDVTVTETTQTDTRSSPCSTKTWISSSPTRRLRSLRQSSTT